MPIPTPNSGESQDDFVGRCHSALAADHPDPAQRSAMCFDAWRTSMNKAFRDALDSIAELRKDVYTEELARVKAEAIASANEPAWELAGNILKADEDKMQVFGWASIVEKAGETETDGEGDQITAEEIEKAIHGYMREARELGDRHQRTGIGEPIEAIVFTAEKQKAIVESLKAQGIDAQMELKSIGAWMGFQVFDKEVWKDVKAGKLKSFSIGGHGVRRAA